MADGEINLTPEQLDLLLRQNQDRDGNREDWEDDDVFSSNASHSEGSASSGGSNSSHTSAPRPKSPVYVPPQKRTAVTAEAFENSAGNPEDKAGKPVGARPGQPGATYRVQSIPYVLTDAQFRYLKKRFPRTLFRATDDQNHDHPIAHTETLVATRHMQQKYRTGIKILDVYGNPTANEYYNQRQNTGRRPTGRTMNSLVHCFTEKDYIRALTKWGPRTVVDNQGNTVERFVDADLRDASDEARLNEFVSGHDHYQFIHTLYYINLELLAALLSSGPKEQRYKSFSAVIHKHALPEGKLFGGEVTYKKHHDVVRQVNRETGESYVHQDLSFLFDSQSKVWRSARHAFTWTFHKVTDETWVIEGAGCPVDMDERFRSYAHHTGKTEAAHRINAESLLVSPGWEIEKYTMPGGTGRMVGGKLFITPQGSKVELKVSNFEFIDYLRYQVASKPRDHEQFVALMSIARREVEAGSRFPGSHAFEVPVDEFHHHVVVAFFMDAVKEIGSFACLQLQTSILSQHRSLAGGEAVYNFADTNSTLRAGVQAARVVHSVIRANDRFGTVLDSIDQFKKF